MLEVCKQLFSQWNESDVHYCHWKSNEHLMEGLDGDTDLDVYVYPSDREKAESQLKECRYIECQTQKGHQYPNVCEWIGFDASTGRLVHVHLHYQIITGTKFCKEFVFPIDELIIATRVLDKDSNVYITNPDLEIIILFCRIALKAKKKRNISISKSDRREIAYLKERIQADNVLQLCKQLTGKDGDALFAIIMEDHCSHDAWYKVYKIAHNWLKPYRKYSPIHVFIRHRYYYFLYLFNLIANKKFNCSYIHRKTFPYHHLSICLLGQDGSGKSTITIELCKWLNWKIDAHRFYLGSGEHYKSLTKWLSSKISRSKGKKDKQLSSNKKVHSQQIDSKQTKNLKSIIGAILASWNFLCIAHRAYKEVKRADKYMKKGGIPLFDRFPQTQFEGIYDGPKINHYCHRKGISLGIVKWMAKRERHYLEQIQNYQPRLVFKLMLSPEESIRRKPLEDIEVVTRKHHITQRLQFPNSVVYTVDATMDYQQEIIYIKNQIWNVLMQECNL